MHTKKHSHCTRVLEPSDILRCKDLSWRSEQKQDSAVRLCCLHGHCCNCGALGSALQSSPCYVSGFRSLGAHDALFKPGWKYMKSCLKHGAHHWIKKKQKTNPPQGYECIFLFFSLLLLNSPLILPLTDGSRLELASCCAPIKQNR